MKTAGLQLWLCVCSTVNSLMKRGTAVVICLQEALSHHSLQSPWTSQRSSIPLQMT